ncbi:MAG: glycosyltransferase family 2 protein [Actinomycetota bacterium]|nr:glycosyltransferase family 2 protein [Actinomycetota bacterium]
MTVEPLRLVFDVTVVVVIGYFVVANGFWTALFVAAAWQMVQHRRSSAADDTRWLLGSSVLPQVSILVPAHNEAATVGESVRALLTLEYPNLQVVLVNDGSTDGTLQTLVDHFELQPIYPIYRHVVATAAVRALYRSRLYPGLVVVDKENGGKADSLNAGLNLATGALVCAIDADTLIEHDALLQIVQPFLAADDVVASGGTIRVVNGSRVHAGRVIVPRAPRQLIAGLQAVEYLRSFLFGRLGWNRLGGNLIVSGAFGLFKRDALRAIGGYQVDSIGEDMELVVRLRRAGIERGEASRVVFVPEPVAWTEVPVSLRVLGRQRDRWQRGLVDVLWRHQRLAFNPRYGAVGLVVIPYFVLVELLGPVIEGLGVAGLVVGLALQAVDLRFALLFVLAVYGWGLLFAIGALLLDELTSRRYESLADRVLLVCWALIEPFGYRQLTVVWQLRGMVRAARGHTDWGEMTRGGFSAGRHKDRS